MRAISSNGTANMSCSTNATRSGGLNVSSTTSSASPTASPSSAACSGSSSKATTGSGTCTSSGSSRRVRRERRRLRQTRATIVGRPPTTHKLVHLRASQINGCSFCVDMHSRELRDAGEPDERIWGVAGWRESPYFDDAERAALALAEAGTRLSDREDPVPDEVWKEAARHYDEAELGSLVPSIASINARNRLNVITRQADGSWG